MQYQPKTEAECTEFKLWPAGDYDFEIVAAENKISSKGNEMIELKVRLFNAAGEVNTVRDWLMEAVAYKLRHAAYTTGLGEKYETGELNDIDFVGRTGRAKVVIKKGEKKEDGTFYEDKNAIQDYLEIVAGATPAAQVPAIPALDDEIPF